MCSFLVTKNFEETFSINQICGKKGKENVYTLVTAI